MHVATPPQLIRSRSQNQIDNVIDNVQVGKPKDAERLGMRLLTTGVLIGIFNCVVSGESTFFTFMGDCEAGPE